MSEKESDVKKMLPHEMHNTELVSKLMAATPSYFFTPPQAGHNFFFSELLRSLVQKRKTDELNSQLKAKSISKKARKPSYHYQKQQPLETEWKRQKLNETQSKTSTDVNENEPPNENSQDSVINVDKDDSPPAIPTSLPSSVIPPANTSAFYPYVDPLHFFIDLRVSAGQVYDRKKEAYLHQALKNNNLLDSTTWNNSIISKNRVGSAFKVPGSTSETNNNNFSAINLVNHQGNIYAKRNSDENSENDDKNDEDVEVFEVDVKHEQLKRTD